MSADWDGVPPLSHRSGWHWLRRSNGGFVCAEWVPGEDQGLWRIRGESLLPETIGPAGYIYHVVAEIPPISTVMRLPLPRCEPVTRAVNGFHEVRWDSTAGGVTLQDGDTELHEVWQWVVESGKAGWSRPGMPELYSAEDAFAEGWRYVARVTLHQSVTSVPAPSPLVLREMVRY